MTNKKTEMELLEEMKGYVADNQELLDYIDKKQTQLIKKKSTPSKADKARAELNQELTQELMETLAGQTEFLCIRDIKELNPTFEEFTSPKIAYLLTQLVKSGKVEKQEIKRIMHYKAL